MDSTLVGCSRSDRGAVPAGARGGEGACRARSPGASHPSDGEQARARRRRGRRRRAEDVPGRVHQAARGEDRRGRGQAGGTSRCTGTNPPRPRRRPVSSCIWNAGWCVWRPGGRLGGCVARFFLMVWGTRTRSRDMPWSVRGRAGCSLYGTPQAEQQRIIAELEAAQEDAGEHFASLQEEIETKTKKLKKLWSKYDAGHCTPATPLGGTGVGWSAGWWRCGRGRM